MLNRPQWINMPNLASCHQAIRLSRVVACFSSMGDSSRFGLGLLGVYTCAEASVLEAVSATAPAAPTCFRNERRLLSLHSMGALLYCRFGDIYPVFARQTPLLAEHLRASRINHFVRTRNRNIHETYS